MKTNQIKIFVVLAAFVSLFALVAFNTTGARTTAVSNDIQVISSLDDDTAASYKKMCAACHTPKAAKFFDPDKSMESHIEAIVKGRLDSKPPMPAYGSKGITEEKAKALVEYMIQLREPKDSNSNASSNTSNTN